MDRLATARALLEDLVAFDTTSSRSNAELVAWLANRVEGPGTQVWDLPEVVRSPATGEDVEQHNLLVRIGPESPGARVLSAHTDCVPVTGQPWSTDPFRLTQVDGRLHGRGACDMKGFVAACLAVVGDLDPATLRVPIVLAFSHSEELGTLGAPSLVQALRQHVPAPELAIVGEPTMMEVVVAHKGVRGAWVTIDGVDAHSSQPARAANANFSAARLISHIDDLARHHAEEGPHDPRFDPPMTTFNVGMVEGGQAINIVPRRARFHVEFRPIPGVDPDAVLDEVEIAAHGEVLQDLGRHVGVERVGIRVEPDADVMALTPERDGPAERLARSCGGGGPVGATVAYGTDGGWLQQGGLSVVVCGPGSIDQAHKPDEHLDTAQLAAGVAFLEALARDTALSHGAAHG